MKVNNIVTQMTALDEPEDIEYDVHVKWTNDLGPQERIDHYKIRAHPFKLKIEGKRYVDGEFTTDYVQYI